MKYLLVDGQKGQATEPVYMSRLFYLQPLYYILLMLLAICVELNLAQNMFGFELVTFFRNNRAKYKKS